MKTFLNNLPILSDVLLKMVDKEIRFDPYDGLRIARLDLKKPYIRFIECDLIQFAIMKLLIKYGNSTHSDYGKFTVGYTIATSAGNVSFTMGKSMVFRENSSDYPVYESLDQMIRKKAEEYNEALISSIFIRIYLFDRKDSEYDVKPLSNDEITTMILKSLESDIVVEPKEAKRISNRKRVIILPL